MKERWLIIGAFGAIYIIWGSTYLANAFAIKEIPPFFMAGGRFLIAGILLFALMLAQRKSIPTPKQWMYGALMGTLFLSIGNGALVKALEYLDSGMAALLIAFDPLLVVLAMWVLIGVVPGKRNIFGTILGIIGMVILIGQPSIMTSKESLKGIGLVSISMVSWTVASIYVAKVDLPKARGRSTERQMITGGILLIIYSLITGEIFEFSIQQMTSKGWMSWIYLVVFGSIIGFSSFNYLLHKVSPDKVSTSTLINPIVALILGWMFNSEQVTLQSIIATVVLLSGVFFINTHKTAPEKKVELSD
ncbi:MAG: EamA family transporter [Bacteroidetes bacterium]|nr:MAG: EamA family transporter [Bacteroidota bacterium]